MKQGVREEGRTVVVLGTGTGVGKTHVVQALAATPGIDALALKPIESGYRVDDPDTDQARLGAEAVAPYLLPTGISPHLAAREVGVEIDLAVVVAWVRRARAGARSPRGAGSWVLVESAGGAMSPLNDREDNLALARRLEPEALILVAPDRLGVLHEVRSTLAATRALAPGLPTPRVVLSGPETADASTGTNGAELMRLHPGLTAVELPRAPLSAPATVHAAAALWSLLRGVGDGVDAF